MSTIINVNLQSLEVVIGQIEIGQFCHLKTITEVRMKKTGNPYFGQILKSSSCNYRTGFDYYTRLWNNGKKEGVDMSNIVHEQMTGRVQISKCLYRSEKNPDQKYFLVERFEEIKPNVEYTFQGNPIEKVMFEQYLHDVYESKKQEPLERKVYPLTFKLESIKELTLDGVKYVVV